MSETKKQCYLWGIWSCWSISILAFALSIRTTLLISLGVMVCLIMLLAIPFLYNKRTIKNVFNFNRKAEPQSNENLSSQVKLEQNVSPLAPSYDDSNTKETVISIGTVLRGEMTNENNISINGVVEGDLTSQKMTQIGKEGQVVGTVKSVKLVVNGLLKGSCYARTVVIMSRGRIEGEVFATEFSIEKGGVFIGNSHQIEEPQLPVEKKEKKRMVTMGDSSPSLIAVENTQGKIDSSPGRNVAAGN
ncbi:MULTISPECIES: bactofilin family protein [Erwinia]|uniref:bactofilin family protein n=1 Tax=Erwinia TaxID=551 RepID=UPI001060D70F|nr:MULTISPECIES: polymer-forming cytoskeletal protein [Erwinia]MCS3609977.1 cytoskeletal protein CcmA (bactofilin family) [Erwinia rhapontici]NNS10182.1 polymer-forming cytoskeletal protein [Erwinia sp. JH02]TDS88790.1 cytoskeletal protein CcmA (bactofilin family) [Erwinia rhapontici]UDQ79994.1 polymer-forming cytoskeletal protein [Erwinia rhapontici]